MSKSKKTFTVEEVIAKKHSFLYYAFPKNLVNQIKLMGFTHKTSKMIITYAVILTIALGSGYVFKLGFPFQTSVNEATSMLDYNIVYYIILIVAAFLLTPTIIRNSYLNRYELKRFGDVNLYIEQMLYSFKDNQKILIALMDVQTLFPSGAMREVIDEAIHIISNKRDDHSIDVERYALDVIEKRYPNEQIKAMHRFLKKSEDIGGENITSINILLTQRKNWENRVYKTMDMRKKQKMQIIGSIVATIAMACSMLYILPAEVDIAGNPLAKTANVALIIVCMFIYTKTDAKLAISLITPQKNKSDKRLLSDYKSFVSFNAKTMIKQSLLLSIIPLVVIIIGYLIDNNLVLISGIALFIIVLSSSFLGHNITKKNVLKEVQKAFPQWLMELAMLLQSENVQMAIFKTIETAPAILKPELIKLQNALIKDPASSAPYLNFFSTLEVPTITSTMQMLYSLANGNGGEANTQIMNIIERNNGILERAEELEAEESLSSLYMLFLLPILAGAGVLLVDMSLFLITYMSNLTPM